MFIYTPEPKAYLALHPPILGAYIKATAHPSQSNPETLANSGSGVAASAMAKATGKLRRQEQDIFYHMAKDQGYRSRAAI